MGFFDDVGKAVSGVAKAGGFGVAGLLASGALNPSKASADTSGSTIANQEERKKIIDEQTKKILAAQENAQNTAATQGAVKNASDLAGMAKANIGSTAITNQIMANAQNNNLQNAYALAASQKGAVNPALAQRAAMDQIAQGNQQIVQQGLTSGLQEQNQNFNQAVTANTGAANIATQARTADLQFQQMQNELVQKYLALGFSQDQAQAQASLDAARIQAGISTANTQAQNQFIGSLISGGSAIAAKAATGGAAPV